ncbi:MAG: adenosine deaminase [bacterium]|nr:adenosine deaminase [bacterium]
MPKAELHVHLEGSIRAPTILQLASRRNVELPARDEDGIERWLDYRDFDHFIEVYLTISRCLRDPEDFQLATEAFLEQRARESILYTEAHFTISTHVANGANGEEVADALAETVSAGERDLGVRLRWIPDIVRNVDYGRADQTLEWALDHRDKYVVALGLSGKEDHPAQPFREHFGVAAREGLHRTVHAGEQTGPDAVWDALEHCGAERIGHGIRSVEDPRLLELLRERDVPLEVSPTSNLRLGLIPSLEEHPLRELHAAGVPWSLNSDDPALFRVSLTEEIESVADLLDLDLGQMAGVSMAALEQAFLDDADRIALKDRFRAWFAQAGVDPEPR